MQITPKRYQNVNDVPVGVVMATHKRRLITTTSSILLLTESLLSLKKSKLLQLLDEQEACSSHTLEVQHNYTDVIKLYAVIQLLMNGCK